METEAAEGLLENAVVASGTGGGDVIVGAHEPQVHGQKGAAHVGDGERYTEWVHLPVALQQHTTTAQHNLTGSKIRELTVSNCTRYRQEKVVAFESSCTKVGCRLKTLETGNHSMTNAQLLLICAASCLWGVPHSCR